MVYSNRTVKTTQILIYPFMHLFFKIFFKTNLKITPNLKKENRYIFTPNHPWRMDPFLIFYLMPFKTLVKILPLRFMTAKQYMINPANKLLLGLLGCYIIDSKTLDNSVDMLNNKSNLCIFIQGKVNTNNKEKPKVGAIYINNKYRKSHIIPVKININKKITFLNILLRRIKINILFKYQFTKKITSKNLQPITNELLNEIKN